MISIEKAKTLEYALQKFPQDLEAFSSGESLKDFARQNDKRPAFLSWYVPDEWVKNLVGKPELQDIYIVMRIPRQAIEEVRSPIIRPQHSGSVIVP